MDIGFCEQVQVSSSVALDKIVTLQTRLEKGVRTQCGISSVMRRRRVYAHGVASAGKEKGVCI